MTQSNICSGRSAPPGHIYKEVANGGKATLLGAVPGLGKVCQEGGEDVPGELGVAGGHLQLVPPNAIEDVLQVVPVGHSHVNLQIGSLKIHSKSWRQSKL